MMLLMYISNWQLHLKWPRVGANLPSGWIFIGCTDGAGLDIAVTLNPAGSVSVEPAIMAILWTSRGRKRFLHDGARLKLLSSPYSNRRIKHSHHGNWFRSKNTSWFSTVNKYLPQNSSLSLFLWLCTVLPVPKNECDLVICLFIVRTFYVILQSTCRGIVELPQFS